MRIAEASGTVVLGEEAFSQVKENTIQKVCGCTHIAVNIGLVYAPLCEIVR